MLANTLKSLKFLLIAISIISCSEKQEFLYNGPGVVDGAATSRICSVQPANSSGGADYTNDSGVTWSTCTGFTCDATFSLVGGNCVTSNQTQACAIANGTGSQASTDGGVTWGACSVVSCDATYTSVLNVCVLTSQTQACAIANGTGVQASPDGGVTWGACSVASCNATYSNVSNSCVPSSQTQACAIANGTGSQSSVDGGVTWGVCGVVSCNATYTNVSNSCVATNQNQACAIANGTGSQSSTDGGVTFGACNVISCNATYTNVSNSCVSTNQNQACAIANGTGSQSSTDGGVTFGVCNVASCNVNYHTSANTCAIDTYTINVTKLAGRADIQDTSFAKINCGNACTSDTQSYDYSSMVVLDATIQLGYTITGWAGCDSTSLSETRCTITSISANRIISPTITCSVNYTLVGGNCVLTNQNQACAISNGTGSQSSTDGGVTWGTCNVASCNATYSNVGNTCSLTNQSQACAISNGTGSQSTTDGGASWSACSVVSCNATYTNVSNTCVLTNQNQACAIANGTGSQSSVDGGVTWGSCSVSSCNATYTNVSNSCVLTNQSQACAISNGTGSQSSTDGGVTWGSCGVVSCNATYTNVSNSCVLTNQTQVCAISNGTGSQSSTDGGVTWGSCGVVSCNSGYVNRSNACVDPIIQTKVFSAGGNFTCYLKTNKIYCSGINLNGQLGNGNNTSNAGFVQVVSTGVLSGKTLVQVSCGYYHCLVLDDQGKIYAWGANDVGQLGNNSIVDSNAPVAVDTTGALNGETVTAISGGYDFSCAKTLSNKGVCWGYNNAGQLGTISTVDKHVPTLISMTGALSGETVQSISAGYDHSCVFTNTNKVACVGANANGQLGNNTFTSNTTPVALYISGVLSGKTIKYMNTQNSKSTCVITTELLPYCWGSNDVAQLGNSNFTDQKVPNAVNTAGVLSGNTVYGISAGNRNTCVVTNDYNMACFGSNASGNLGVNNTSIYSTPVTVLLTGKTFKDFSVGTGAICGSVDTPDASASNLYCWGWNSYGELGDGTTTDRWVPTVISGTTQL